MTDLILPRRRLRAWPAALAAGALALAVWGAPIPPTQAQSPSAKAVGIHKLQGASWQPEHGQILFVAVMGSDARSGPPDAGGGCDAIHIVAINPQAKAGTILNFPRDSFLEDRKITDTCRQAGFGAAVQVLVRHTGIPIQFLVKTEFSHFRKLIDDLGGIDVNVPYAMSDPASGAYFNAGPAHMDGGAALAFTRNRKHTPNGDFSRTDNQGIMILASLHKFKIEIGDPHRLFDYIAVARRHTTLAVGVGDLFKMAMVARQIEVASIRNVTVPGSTGSVGTASVVFLHPGDTYDRVRDDGIY